MSEESDNLKIKNKKPYRLKESNIEDVINQDLKSYEMMLNRRINYKEYPLSVFHKGVSLFVLFIITYPFYTEFLRRRITSIFKDLKRQDYDFRKLKLFGKGALYVGFPVFFLSKFIPYFLVENLRISEKNYFYGIIIFNFIGYPLLINSNMRALKMNEALKLKKIKNILILYSTPSNYRGVFYFLFSSWLFYIPILNYFCHYLESARLLYSLGHYYGHDFKTLKETRIHLKKKKFLNLGRLYFNFPAHMYNIYFFYCLTRDSNQI